MRPRLRHRTLEDYAAHFRALLDDSLRDRLQGRGRTALSLSGGLDSASLAASAATIGLPSPGSPIHAISYVFDELHPCDERRYIEPLVARYGLPSTTIPGDELWPLHEQPAWPRHPHHTQLDPYAHLTRAVRLRAAELGGDTLVVGNYGDALFDGGRFWIAEHLRALRLAHTIRVLARDDVALPTREGWWRYGLRPLMPRGVLRGGTLGRGAFGGSGA